MDRTGQAEGTEGVAAWSTKMKLEAPTAGTAGGYPSERHTIDGNEAVYFRMIAEDCLYAPQIATAFLPNIAREHDVAHGFDAALV